MKQLWLVGKRSIAGTNQCYVRVTHKTKLPDSSVYMILD